MNVGTIQDLTTTASATVTGTGSQNVAGGLVGLNLGLIDPSTSAGNVRSGPDSIVGGLIGVNAAFSNFGSGLLSPSTFPIGTVSADSTATGSASGGSGSTVGSQIGLNYPTSGLPAYPQFLGGCDNALCFVLATGILTDPNGKQNANQNANLVNLVQLSQLNRQPEYRIDHAADDVLHGHRSHQSNAAAAAVHFVADDGSAGGPATTAVLRAARQPARHERLARAAAGTGNRPHAG